MDLQHYQGNLNSIFNRYFWLTNLEKKESFSDLEHKAYRSLNRDHHNSLLNFSTNFIDAKNYCMHAIFYYGIPGYILYLKINIAGLKILKNSFNEIIECEINNIFEILLIAQHLYLESIKNRLTHFKPAVNQPTPDWDGMKQGLIELGLASNDIHIINDNVASLIQHEIFI